MFENSNVKIITCADFKDDKPWCLKNDRCAFVLFYADWCGHCKNFKPEYEKFADIAQFIKVYALNSDDNREFIEKLNGTPAEVTGFPTLYLYSNGEPIENYDGERTWQKLLSSAKKLCNEKCKCDKF